MSETIVLDPSEVATARTQLDITSWAKADGIDWGDAEIQAYLADSERGSTPVDFRIPNRQIVIPLVIKAISGTATFTFAQARQQLQAKVARIQQEGGWIKRTTTSGTLFANVVNASLRLGGDWFQANRNVDINAELRLEAIPDWYGPEVTLGDHVQTGGSELTWTENNIAGNYPGRLRLVVDDDSGQRQQGLIYGIRCRHYSNATTAQLKYEAETCTPLDQATIISGTIRHGSLASDWTPIMSTDQTGGVALTHTGTYRVWVRLLGNIATSGTTVSVRLLWDVGDFNAPAVNTAAVLPLGDGLFHALDLGEIRLDRTPSGIHRWRGVIQALGQIGGEVLSVDKIWLVPVDEGYGVLRAPWSFEAGLANYTGRDEFNQTGGNLTGKSAPTGGVWQGFGDADDFVVDFATHLARRTTSLDSPPDAGRVVTLPNTVSTAVHSQVWAWSSTAGPSHHQATVARFTDINNYVYAGIHWEVNSTVSEIGLRCYQGGAITHINRVYAPVSAGAWYIFALEIDAAGRYQYRFSLAPSTRAIYTITGHHSSLATGGGLASGTAGMLDSWYQSAAPATRYYKNFLSYVPTFDAALHPNQSAELRTEGMYREDATGTAFGPVTQVVGDLPRIPASGTEGRVVEFFLKHSRGDLDSTADPANIDALSARVSYRPSYLFVS